MANSTDTPQGYAPFDLYPYNPSQAPAFAFLGLFGVVCVLHVVAMIPYRSFFPFPLIIGCGMEAAAYYFRSQSHDNLRQTLPFLLQNLLLLSAPPFLAASIYMSPRRIARALDGEHLTVAPRLLTKLFVLIDTICFATQVAGSIMSGSEDINEAKNGQTIILAGLALQIVAFGFFAFCTACFQKRVLSASYQLRLSSEMPWQRYIYGLYAISLLFVIRNITRIIEFKQGSDGGMLQHEAYLYVLDGCIMLCIVVIFLILHPGRLRWMARRLEKSGSLDEHIPLS
ncbi:hypothetical protein FSARC_1615 [Fusarium sarcochroum]|uniref:Uncharacterized protein n=1 Tax=Fusarium sarcochroum TaxID=1208366 RepID=A0A8H4U815_9HYPO|nr:hypothetical protein FSARC_1615 [Fusarium sarcochroum]